MGVSSSVLDRAGARPVVVPADMPPGKARALVLTELSEVLLAFGRVDAQATIDLCAMLVDEHGAGEPWPSLTVEHARKDARLWADAASTLELQAVLAAAIEALGARIETVAPAGRKRLLVALWGTLGDAEKRAFLSKVDPRGVFRG